MTDMCAAIVHPVCGHAAAIARDIEDLTRDKADTTGPWVVIELPLTEAVERYREGPCATCRPTIWPTRKRVEP